MHRIILTMNIISYLKNAFNSDIKNHEFTKEFMVEDLDLIQYINAVITA